MIDQAIVLPPSDPRRRVAGLPLLDRTLLALARAGVRRAYVVGQAQDVGNRDHARSGIAVQHIPSLGAARAVVGGLPFLLSLADHVYEPGLAKLAAAADLEGVDACVTGEAPAGGVGCGLLAARATLFAAVETAGGSIAAAIAALAKAGRVRALPVGDLFWADAGNAAGAERAERELFRRLRKPVDGPVARHLNRPISLSITRLLVNREVTPNQMSIAAGIVGLVGVAVVFGAHSWLAVVVGAVLVQTQSILDGCDGEIARLKFQSSKAGEWLDNVTDDALNIVYCAAIGVAAARLVGQPALLWVGVAGGVSYAVFMAVLNYQLATVHHSGSPFVFRWWFQPAGADLHATLARPGLATRVTAVARALGRRDVMMLAFVGLAALHQLEVLVIWYAAIGVSNFAVAVTHVAMGGVAAARRVEEGQTAPTSRNLAS